ncbi:MAG: dihydroorotase [Dissulfuribacterales bacterium]
MELLLENARLLDPASGLNEMGAVLVRNGRIEGIFPAKDGLPKNLPVQRMNINGHWLVPGLIDMHVHLREPGEEYKETIATGTRAAAAGGFTAVACMPNTRPVNDDVTVTTFIRHKAELEGSARVYPVACITRGQQGKELTEMGLLLEAGAVAFSDDGRPVNDAAMMRLAMEYARGFDALIISHAEELSLVGSGVMNEGRVSQILGLKGIPSVAEEIAVFRDIALARYTGARLHIAHVSTKGAVELIRRAKNDGVRVTAETAPHYFTLTEEAVSGYNTNAKMNPPLRTEEDRQAVIEGLKDGTLNAIATDHAPHSVLEKEIEFERAANGIIGLETAVPLALELVRQNHLTPLQLIACLSFNPALILGVAGGRLKKGESADLCVIDVNAPFECTQDNLLSKGHNTPFLNQTLIGRAVLTMKAGQVTHNLLW